MSDVWVLTRALHLLAMAFFVGGQLVFAFAVVPVERRSPNPVGLRAVARRFAWGTLVALALLVATGAAMATKFDQWGESALQLKLALVLVGAALIVWHIRRPDLRALDGAIFVTSLVIVWLGVTLAH